MKITYVFRARYMHIIGRDKIIDSLWALMEKKHGLVLTANRRIEKTTIIKEMQRKAGERGFTAIYQDLEAISSPDDFAKCVSKEVMKFRGRADKLLVGSHNLYDSFFRDGGIGVVMNAQKKESETYSLRMPTELKKRLERLAESQNRSLNQQILRILNVYVSPNEEPSTIFRGPSGRFLQIQADPIKDALQDATLLFFKIIDTRNDHEVKTINFGLGRTLLRDFHIKEPDRDDAVLQIGSALLKFYSSQGIEPEHLSWNQYIHLGYPNMRVIHSSEVPAEIATLEEFLNALAEDDWTDYFLVGNYLNDINRAVSEASSISQALELAEQIIAITTESYHLIGDGPWWQTYETQLLAVLIAMTARKRTVGMSQLRYMRSLVNLPKVSLLGQISVEDKVAVAPLLGLEDGKKAMTFARVNQRLLKLAPQALKPLGQSLSF